ncbi:MAG: Phosphoribosylformylglycinamidine synthase, PurS subunit / Phosphoribosylformylglycinamidine synthase, synthetase subunit, partial [uncultured Chloroflexia bacterium]
MSAYLVIVRPRFEQQQADHPLRSVARDLHIVVEGVTEEHRYLIGGTLEPQTLMRLADELLLDRVATTATVVPLDDTPAHLSDQQGWAVDIAYRPGVTDNEGDSIRVGAEHAGIQGIVGARTVQRVVLSGALEQADATRLAHRVLANDLVEAVLVTRPDDFIAASTFYKRLLELPAQTLPRIHNVSLADADDDALLEISRTGVLALDLDEMRTIQEYFQRIGRNPTDGELETVAQTWSEHCSHKTFKAHIQYRSSARSEDVASSDYPK